MLGYPTGVTRFSQKPQTWYSRRYGPAEGGYGGLGVLFRCELRGAGLTGGDHVWLKERSLEEHVVVSQCLVCERQHLYSQGNV